MIKLRPYQEELYSKMVTKLDKDRVKKLCVVLPTGGGKSVVIAKLAQELKGRTLILTHRIEILKQNSEWLKSASLLTADDNTLRFDSPIVVAMVQTAYSRIKKYGIEYLGEFDNIILDEVQVLIFEKVFKKYKYKRLIGFTATPVFNKKIYTTVDGVEYVEPFTMSELFDDIVQGVDTEWLIENGYLCRDFNVVLELPNFDMLKESSVHPDGYTSESLNNVYCNAASLRVLGEAYDVYCRGKKSLIFNASTKINRYVYKFLKNRGINVKMFDTVNKKDINPKTGEPFTRKEIIDWFKNERDAVLINTNVFTTGFDVDDVEVVLVNRATKSLSLWIQMVGRGSRITKKIFKEVFTVIDLGQNINEHGIWSKPRNWENYFYPHSRRRKHKYDLLDVWECHMCGSYNVTGEVKCEICGRDKKNVVVKRGRSKPKKDGTLIELAEMPVPTAKKIIDYTISKGEGSSFAFRLLEQKILELFVHYRVDREFYMKNRARFAERIRSIYLPIYFSIIRSDLDGANKKLVTQLKRTLGKVDKFYNYERQKKN
jgi:superfamily II DNA or RNA helicase